MKRQLLETTEKQVVVCDNPECDFEVDYKEHGLTLKYFIDSACPKCGQNLLTEKDYIDYITLMKTVAWINKWFSWITIFFPKKSLDNPTTLKVHVHNGINIKEE